MMISEESTERYWKRKREFFEDKNRINAVLQYIAVRKQRHSNKQNYKAYSKLESLLRKASRDSWNKHSEKKWSVLRQFYASVNEDSARFSASFIIVNNPFINYNSL